MESENKLAADKPSSVLELEKVFGGPSQSAFGTAVFFEPSIRGSETLEQRALAWYQYFCGKTWERFGPENWLATWKAVHAGGDPLPPIISALKELTDSDARRSASTMLEGHQDPAAAQSALALAFDDAAVKQRQVCKIGDGEAMSGILIAARRDDESSVFLVFLLD